MASGEIHVCECADCRAEIDPPNRELHRQINLVMSRLDEQQRRWFAAVESERIGRGGDTLVSRITGLDEGTIRRGRSEIADSLEGRPPDRVRSPGGGRRPLEKKTPRS
jgi:hypothetical protein